MNTSLLRLLATALLILPLSPLLAEPEPESESEPATLEDSDTAEPKALLPLDSLRTFTEAFDRIKRAYVEEVDDKTLLNNAIQGMLSGLDPHSSYLEAEALDDLQSSTQGKFGGLGIEVELDEGFVRVVAPIDDTPAIRAGIESGDLIIKIDGESVKGMSLRDAVTLMRGEPGSEIILTVAREGVAAPFDITIVRDIIKVTSVKHSMIDEGYGYIRVTQFQTSSGRDLRKALKKLHQTGTEDDGAGLKGLVLDLRNNPGGVLNAAVEISDAFLSEGLIVYTQGRIENAELRYSATPDNPSHDVPVAVLINGGSASASEIVAGALQDHHRAVIIGTPSFGKGSVQTILPLTDNQALKLTTARYYTPSGRSIQAEGITPDLLIETAKVTRVESQPFFKEADLHGHLDNGNGKKTKEKKRKAKKSSKQKTDDESDADQPKSALELAQRDFQLYEALNLLKGINILQQAPASAKSQPESEPESEKEPAQVE